MTHNRCSNATTAPSRRAAGVETDGNYNYLDVRYSERARPYTEYPGQLTEYLTDRVFGRLSRQSLLDLGSGRGEFLHGFARQGFDAIGIDRSRPSAPRFNEPVIEADYERAGLPFADGEFSVLFSKSVFEHISDISSLLRECHRVLAPSGRMIALVPDWTAQWRHFYDDWTHVRPFTLNGLRECVACHGFEVKRRVAFSTAASALAASVLEATGGCRSFAAHALQKIEIRPLFQRVDVARGRRQARLRAAKTPGWNGALQ